MEFDAVIDNRKQIAQDTYEIRFSYPDQPFSFKAGQYIHLQLPQLSFTDPRGEGRDFSLVGAPGSEFPLTIAIRKSESGFKKTLLQLPLGTKVGVSGPFGGFTLPEVVGRDIVFIAGGIGITPFMSMIRYNSALAEKHRISLIYQTKTMKRAAYRQELKSLAFKHPTFELIFKTTRLSSRTMKPYLEKKPLFYVAGPPGMVSHALDLFRQMGVAAKNIKTEEFTGDDTVNFTTDKKYINQVISSSNIVNLPERMEGEFGKRSLTDLEALLQALNHTAIVSETNAAGTITFVNDKFVEISKYSREELIGQNHRILKSHHHPQAFYDNMWATITRGRLWRGLIKNKANDGSYYWVDTSIAPIRNQSGQTVKYISVRFPITDRQIAEEELQDRARQQNVLTTLSQAALASIDLKSLCQDAVNLISETLPVDFAIIEKLRADGSGFDYEAGVGWDRSSIKDFVISPDASTSMAGYTLLVNEPIIVEDLATESRFSGSTLLHDHNIVSGASVIIHAQDRPFGILGVFSLKKMDFSQDHINFIQAVANLIANAARNQLDKRKDEFLGIASHELRTPITSIKTFLKLLERNEKKKGDQKTLLLIDRISRQVNRMTELIGDLLDISRINSGKLEYQDDYFPLSKLVKEVIAETELLDDKHHFEFKNGIKQQVYGDPYRIGQVIQNLLSNAIKYSPKGGDIIITTKAEKDYAIVSVKDFGVGIPEKEQKRIFDRFYQGDFRVRESFPGGLGLGLFISSEIIKRYQGRLWVESQPGKGSVFSFTLPVNKS